MSDGLANGEVFTTSAWYYRLGRAAFSGSGIGSLSGRLERLDGPTGDQDHVALQELPADIGLLHVTCRLDGDPSALGLHPRIRLV